VVLPPLSAALSLSTKFTQLPTDFNVDVVEVEHPSARAKRSRSRSRSRSPVRRRKGSDAAASAHGSQANGDGKAEDDADNVLALSDAGEGRPGSDDDEEGDARNGDDEAKAAAKAAPEEATGGDVPETYRLPYHVRAPDMDVCTGLGAYPRVAVCLCVCVCVPMVCRVSSPTSCKRSACAVRSSTHTPVPHAVHASLTVCCCFCYCCCCCCIRYREALPEGAKRTMLVDKIPLPPVVDNASERLVERELTRTYLSCGVCGAGRRQHVP